MWESVLECGGDVGKCWKVCWGVGGDVRGVSRGVGERLMRCNLLRK